MDKGRRYKKKYKRDTINKKKVFMVGAIIVIIFICIFKISNRNKKESVDIISNNVNEENVVSEEVAVIIEPEEDQNIKSLIENVTIEKELNNNNFSFFYYNMDLKKYYFYNKDTYFTAASTIKLPIAMLYYDKIRNGELTSESTITYTSSCYEPGAGTTAYKYSVGSKVPINFLLEQSIVNSDNTAVNILIKNLGYKNCKQQISSYSLVELSEDFYSQNITNAQYSYDVVNHLYENINNYPELIEDMKISSNEQYLKKYLQNNDVAHKYGSYNGYVHDYGIVFGETNYLIGIFTKGIPSADEFIADTSLKIFNVVNEN